MPKLLRITNVPISSHLLLKGQFAYMQQNGFEVFLANSAGKEINASILICNIEIIQNGIF